MATLVELLQIEKLLSLETRGRNDIVEVLEFLYPKIEEKVYQYIDLNFENEEVLISKRCFFHVKNHTRFVVEQTDKMVQAYIAQHVTGDKHSDQMLRLLAVISRYAALFHDIQQDFIVKTQDLRGKQRRMKQACAAENENRSAQLLELLLEIICNMSVKRDTPGSVLHDPDLSFAIVTGRKMIWNTTFLRNEVTGKFERMGLKNSRSFFDVVVAVADLSASFVDPNRTIQDGNNLFLESNLWIFEAIEQATKQKEYLSVEMCSQFLEEYHYWSKQEIAFLVQRKSAFFEEIEKLPEEDQTFICETLGDKIDESIALARLWEVDAQAWYVQRDVQSFFQRVMGLSQQKINQIVQLQQIQE